MPVSEGPKQDPGSGAGGTRWVWLHCALLILLVLGPAIAIVISLADRLSVQMAETRRALEAEAAARKDSEEATARLKAEERRRRLAEWALQVAEAGLAERDESARRRSMAACSGRLSTRPGITSRTAEIGSPATAAVEEATRLLAQGMSRVAQDRHAEAEPLLLQALERLDVRGPGDADLLETRRLSCRWRVLTGLERVYGPSGLNLPLRRAVVEELARRPAAGTSGVLTGQVGILPSSELGGAETWLNLYGDAAAFKVTEALGDVTVSPGSGTLPARLHVVARGMGLHPFSISVEAGPRVLRATGVLFVAEWDVKFFKWDAGSSPTRNERGWQDLIVGKPLAQLKTNSIHFTWWDGAPAPGVPADDFGTVATTSIRLKGGRYKIWVSADDGVRVWIDESRLIDDWRWRPPRENSIAVKLNEGIHRIRIEHFEETKHAQLHFGMELLD